MPGPTSAAAIEHEDDQEYALELIAHTNASRRTGRSREPTAHGEEPLHARA
uniref:hypothetical protein n=1 Tax=Streptomyces phaeochromogenes TaxID=1923 RepID=UPI00155DC34A|nr:hypothetical protein [Streptomyces phaeochromogenes]